MGTPNSALPLRGIVEPEPPGFQLAAGWWVLIIVSVAVTLAGFLWIRRHRRQNAYRREAISQLSTWHAHNEIEMARLNQLLKRVALTSFGRQTAAQASGEPWKTLLTQSTKKPIFTPEVLDAIVHHYRHNDKPDHILNTEKAVTQVKRWIQQHQQDCLLSAKPHSALENRRSQHVNV
nr:DUF4381 domain-containing protein [Marinibactrum halimedae]